jgi:receptor protein-tyrosine kinase
VSDDPVSPRTYLNLAVGGLIGLLIGVGAAIARHILDRTVSSQEHVQEVTDKPVLASIGFDGSIKKNPLLTDLGSFAPRTEAFRVLRTNLQFLVLDHQPRCLVISSALQGEGKTMTSTNLAVALAQTGRTVLIIDADLRRPRVASTLGVDPAVGLTTALVGKTQIEDAIQVHEPSGLHVLASGAKPPNPTEILQSRVTHDLIRRLRQSYDMIIIDAPPLLPVADASVLSTLADGSILVVRHGQTTRDQINEAVNRVNQVGGRLYGVVVNMVAKRAIGSYYYYYYEETSPVRDGGKSRKEAPKGRTAAPKTGGTRKALPPAPSSDEDGGRRKAE